MGVQASSEMVSVKGVAVKESFLKNIYSKIRQKLYWKSAAAGLMERSVQILHIWFKSSLIYTGGKYNSECLQPSIEHSGGFVRHVLELNFIQGRRRSCQIGGIMKKYHQILIHCKLTSGKHLTINSFIISMTMTTNTLPIQWKHACMDKQTVASQEHRP